jgi:hypothetical protein
MLHRLFLQKGADLFKLPIHGGVGVKDKLPCEEGNIGGEPAVIIDRTVNIETVPNPRLIVLLAMAGSRMHTARPGVQGDIRGKEKEGIPIQVRMAAHQAFQGLPVEFLQDPV